MFPDPAICGRKIPVRVPSRAMSPWPVIIVVVVVAFVLVIFVAHGLPLIPLAAWLYGRRWRPPAPPRWIVLDARCIAVDGRVIQLNGIRVIEIGRREVVLRLKRRERVRVDLRSLAEPARRAFVRHLEARRMLVFHRRRPRAEQAALEAFYVYDAHAVRVWRNVVREILPPSGPWSRASVDDVIYVREAPRAATAYRDADAGVVAIGSLS